MGTVSVPAADAEQVTERTNRFELDADRRGPLRRRARRGEDEAGTDLVTRAARGVTEQVPRRAIAIRQRGGLLVLGTDAATHREHAFALVEEHVDRARRARDHELSTCEALASAQLGPGA